MMLFSDMFKFFAAMAFAPHIDTPAPSSSASIKFTNMLLIILENVDYNPAIADPNLRAFASSGVLFDNWRAITHPSQPNYIAMTSGATNGVRTDAASTVAVDNIADLLEAEGLTWKSYQENWPGDCFTGAVSPDRLYYRKHNPFISYANIQTNSTRCANIVDASQLSTDISHQTLPNFAWYTPNIRNDGHNTGITYAGTWLGEFLSSTNATSHFDVVLVTFDETQSWFGTNRVYTAIAGKAVKNPGTVNHMALNHYSLLKTLETNFRLGNLGKSDVFATAFGL